MARAFYEDDELVVTKPGFNKQISETLKHQEGPHGNVKFVEGMGVRSLPYLETQLSKARKYVHSYVLKWEAEVGTQLSALQNEVNTVSNQINLLVKEPVLPNIIYILTFTLTGSIVANRRSLPLRFLSPTVFGIGSFAYTMPNSFKTTKETLKQYESEHFPEVYAKQCELLVQLEQQKREASRSVGDLNVSLQEKIHNARQYLGDILK